MPGHVEDGLASGMAATANSFLQKHLDVKFIHHHWMTPSGVLQACVLTRDHCLKLVKTGGAISSHPRARLGLLARPEWAGLFRQGATATCQDWSSARIIKRSHASGLCDMAEPGNCHEDSDAAQPLQRCPRAILREFVREIESQRNIEYLVGFELEFYLVDHDIDLRTQLKPSSWRSWSYSLLASALRGVSAQCVGNAF